MSWPLTASGDALFAASPTATDAEGDQPAVFGALARIDRRTGAVERHRVIHDPDSGLPYSLAVGGAGLWAVGSDRLVRFDPETLETQASYPSGAPPGSAFGSVAVGDDAVFAANGHLGEIHRFDPATGTEGPAGQ